ncbi:DUF6538 domain-containing protein [Novosphingobium aquiterrae]|uniref:DUF6538 domain-containing protein n=1 Tax=Novosphingobium aquiterrae TaxID=624388 RepID=A0ABV6PK11_9SPHN
MCTHLDKTGSTYYFRRPVPKDLIGHFLTATGQPRTEWKFSLRTKDREEAKRLLRPHVADTDKIIDEARSAIRTAPAVSTAREREEQAAQAALAAESAARQEARSELRTLWRKRKATSTALLTPEQAAAVDLINEQGAEIEELRRAKAVMEAGNERLGIIGETSRRSGSALSLLALYERYAATGTANPKTVAKWRARVADLVTYLGHDDASKVSRADLNRWVEALIAKGLAKKTVTAGYLPAIRVTFAVAYDDGAIPTNPASAIKVKAPKTVKLRERDLTDDETQTILLAALGPQPDRLSPEHALARRWVPWLCAYTGARVGEITQLRAKDIRQEQGIWVVHITPDAGSVKTYEARSVPLHPHLIEQGVTALAKAGNTSPLFYRQGAGNGVNPASAIRAADLAKWVRTLGITAPAPNHGWRHRWKSVSRAVGIPAEIADRIQGHAPSNEGGKYGVTSLSALRDAIHLVPRIEADEESALT